LKCGNSTVTRHFGYGRHAFDLRSQSYSFHYELAASTRRFHV
jgi:hypothetical protein